MEIKISRSTHTCPKCGRAFVHEEEIRSLVRWVENTLTREDYCPSCWSPEIAEGAYSTWSVRYYDPKVAEQEPPEVFSPLRRTFYDAIEADHRAEQAVAFLAAQLLRRQKVFRLVKESSEAEGELKLILYADRIVGKLIEVRDPSFTYAELDAARGVLLARIAELERPQTEEQQEERLDHVHSETN